MQELFRVGHQLCTGGPPINIQTLFKYNPGSTQSLECHNFCIIFKELFTNYSKHMRIICSHYLNISEDVLSDIILKKMCDSGMNVS